VTSKVDSMDIQSLQSQRLREGKPVTSKYRPEKEDGTIKTCIAVSPQNKPKQPPHHASHADAKFIGRTTYNLEPNMGKKQHGSKMGDNTLLSQSPEPAIRGSLRKRAK
ncbi:hypothetical protein HispidOSU_000228, partial [Sigmodon hispidus]